MSGDWSSDVCSSDLFPSHDILADDYYEYGKGQVWMKAPNIAVSVHSFHRTVHDGINLRGTLPVGLDLNVNRAVTAFALAWTGIRRGIR